MVIKLFEKNVYLKEAQCEIIDIIESDNEILLELNQTIFFPEGGGQPSDIGYVGESKVLHVFEKDDKVYHQVDKMPEEKDVNCTINWERRFDHMQQHCGEHILSGVLLKEYGLHNKGFHLGEDYVTIDIDVAQMNADMITKIELKANEAIYENREVHLFTVGSKNDAKKYLLRKMPDIDSNVRIVQIDNVDCVACCGTHPVRTGEVGIIKILKSQKYKGMTRVFFKCGKRALDDYRIKHDIIYDLNKKHSTDVTTLVGRIEKEDQKNKSIRDELKTVRMQLSYYEAQTLINESNNKLITKIYDEKSMDELNLIFDNLLECSSKIIILGSLNEGKIILGQNGSSSINCGKLLKDYISDYDGRGGGSPTKAQGVFQSSQNMTKFYQDMKVIIKNENL